MSEEAEIVPVRRTGRPSVLTPALTDLICSAIRAGAYYWVAAEAAGVTYTTLNRWLNSDKPEHLAFRAEVEKAKAQARLRAEVRVAAADPKFWLTHGPGRERGGREGWSNAQHVELTGKNGGPITLAAAVQTLDLRRLTPDELDQYERLTAKATASVDQPSDQE